ncbi:sensor histidine kinase [Aureibaculum sp. 2210JD6-5]|uniref:sensor histidine kinase n=1 Tax=Aureibaculum sp. 2210JD6-5 TaxID=3103957 RepID=UPI002ABD83DC|nr:sensor histidine kinase [Aureibaculum sp. 2210JD6-5]
MITTYFMVYYLIPKYLLTKKYILFIIYSIYTSVFSTCLILVAIYGSFIFLSNMEIKNMPPMSRNFVFILILVYLVVAIFSFISLLNHNFKTISKNKALENKILETQLQIKNQELQYLKKQIHPHFLFNTLNTIYGFALKQSKDTPGIILKLSNLLDYILYQVSKPKVSLQKEVSHIEEYIELEKIRFQDTMKVVFVADKIPNKIQIAPMILIPFVENAFKHGSLINGFLQIKIVINFSNDTLNFAIKNTALQDKTKQENAGIGLKNIKKRLDILYLDNYTLIITEKENWYNVNLTILNLKGNLSD